LVAGGGYLGSQPDVPIVVRRRL